MERKAFLVVLIVVQVLHGAISQSTNISTTTEVTSQAITTETTTDASSQGTSVTTASSDSGATDASSQGTSVNTASSDSTDASTQGTLVVTTSNDSVTTSGDTTSTRPGGVTMVTLTVTEALVTYPDDKIIVTGGGALVMTTVKVRIDNGTLYGLDDVEFDVFAANASNVKQGSFESPVEHNLSPNKNVTENVTWQSPPLNATLRLENVECANFVKVCVTIKPLASGADWQISEDGSEATACDAIECRSEGAGNMIASSRLLVAMCLLLTRFLVCRRM